MAETIPPALTDEQWDVIGDRFDFHPDWLRTRVEELKNAIGPLDLDVAGLLAVCNHSLPTNDSRKITARDVSNLAEAAAALRDHRDANWHWATMFAARLSALLRPDNDN